MYSNQIKKICELILDFKFNESITSIVDILEGVMVEGDKTNKYNEVIEYIEMAINNKDYLFLHDLLLYELNSLLS